MNLSKDEIAKQEIIDQAQKLFRQFGLKKTTMDEIATACGKAKSTLYHYYSSKDEVFNAVIEKELISLRRIVKNKVDSVNDLREKLINYFVSFHEEILNKFNLYRIVKQEFIHETIAQIYFQRMMKFEKDYLVRLLNDAYDSAEYREIEKADIPWFSEIMLAAFFGIVKYTLKNEDGIDQEKLSKTAQAIVSKVFA